MSHVYVYDPSATDELSRVRGIGRYIQILRENFPEWKFSGNLAIQQLSHNSIFINPFINFLQRPILTKRIAKKQIAVIHDLIPLKYPAHFPSGITGRLNIFANKLALKNYDAIVTDSEASKKDIRDILRIDEKKIHVIYPCLPKTLNSGKGQGERDKGNLSKPFTLNPSPYCLYVGDVTWNKNLVNLAKAIKITGVNCVFVGKAFSDLNKELRITNHGKDTKNHNSKFKLHDSVNPWLKDFTEFSKIVKGDLHFIFPGFITDEELLHLYQNAICNILVSRDEGFGFSYLEAASQGCPSVLSDIPVFHETAQDSALFARAEHPEDIAEKIQVLYREKDVRLQLQKTAKKRADFFSPHQFTKIFTNIAP